MKCALGCPGALLRPRDRLQTNRQPIWFSKHDRVRRKANRDLAGDGALMLSLSGWPHELGLRIAGFGMIRDGVGHDLVLDCLWR